MQVSSLSYIGVVVSAVLLIVLYNVTRKPELRKDGEVIGVADSYTVFPNSYPPPPPFMFVDKQGNSQSSQALKGKWVFLYFGYSHCPDVCYPILEKVNSVKKFTSPLAEPEIVFISIDAERDDPASLKNFVSHLASPINTVAGNSDDGKKLIEHFAIGVAEYEFAGGIFYNHNSGLILLSPELRPKAYLPSDVPLAKLVANYKAISGFEYLDANR